MQHHPHNIDTWHTVVAAVIELEQKFFIARRSKKDAYEGLWEFPGGKLEEGETEEECLYRELFEEFSIQAEIGEFLCSAPFELNGINRKLLAYHVRSFRGKIQLHEHQEYQWVSLEEMKNFRFPQPDYAIIAALERRTKPAVRRFHVQKLVRNLTALHMEQEGCVVHSRILTDQAELLNELRRKLHEEAEEAIQAASHEDIVAELADVLEVLHALAHANNIPFETIEQTRQQQLLKRGGFSERLFISAIETAHNSRLACYCEKQPKKYPEFIEN